MSNAAAKSARLGTTLNRSVVGVSLGVPEQRGDVEIVVFQCPGGQLWLPLSSANSISCPSNAAHPGGLSKLAAFVYDAHNGDLISAADPLQGTTNPLKNGRVDRTTNAIGHAHATLMDDEPTIRGISESCRNLRNACPDICVVSRRSSPTHPAGAPAAGNSPFPTGPTRRRPLSLLGECEAKSRLSPRLGAPGRLQDHLVTAVH